MARKKRQSKAALIEELNNLLFLDTGRDDSGIVAVARRGAISGDVQEAKITRIKEIINGF